MATPTKGQIDRLGERLKAGGRTEEDLTILDEYRRSFRQAYETVTAAIRSSLKLEPSGREAKTTESIIAKLVRGTIKLSRIQDVAGCRIVVRDIEAQDRVTAELQHLFSRARVFDRRQKPSHGYRAVHVIVHRDDRWVEVQIRTNLQHDWAQLSEKLSDVFDPAIKYGVGDEVAIAVLNGLSKSVADQESLASRVGRLRSYPGLPPHELDTIEAELGQTADELRALFLLTGKDLERGKL